MLKTKGLNVFWLNCVCFMSIVKRQEVDLEQEHLQVMHVRLSWNWARQLWSCTAAVFSVHKPRNWVTICTTRWCKSYDLFYPWVVFLVRLRWVCCVCVLRLNRGMWKAVLCFISTCFLKQKRNGKTCSHLYLLVLILTAAQLQWKQ